MTYKAIFQTLLLLLSHSLIIAQTENFDYSKIPYRKGECLIVIKDTNQSSGLKTFAIKENPVFSVIDNKYKIDRIEEVRSKRKITARSQSTFSKNVIYKLKFKNTDVDIIKVVSELKTISSIVKIEPNYIFQSFETIPDEYSDRQQLANDQWALDKIKAPEGWDLETGDTNVVITILDSGVDWGHPDLKNNIWKNSGEIPNNNIDDDENGYIDDDHGWDFVSVAIDQVAFGEDPEPPDNNPMDFSGHGTHVSGIAGAEANNQTGIAGLAWNCRIMPVRAGYESPDGNVYLLYSDIIAGIYYAVENRTDIINMSFGESFIGLPGPESEIFTILKDAIIYAYNHNVVLVASAGNDPIAGLNTYPAAFDEVISVAATTYANQKATFSAFNSSWIDVAAPGVDILSTYKDDAYTHFNGTSMSAPFVSGLAALIKSQNALCTNNDIKAVIKNEVDVPDSELFIGWGVINVQKALQANTTTNVIANITTPQYGDVAFLDSINITGNVYGDNYRLEYGNGIYPINWTVIDSGNETNNGLIATWHISELLNGTYTLRLSVKKDSRTIYDRTTIRIKRYAYPILKGWPVTTGEEIHSSAVVADLDSDGKQEIIIYGSDGYLYVWNSDGTNKKGWPKYLGASRPETEIFIKQNWLMGTPASADLDNDGYNDIIVGSLDGRIYALNHDGNNLPDFPVFVGGIICSSPTIFDLNNDGIIEIICRSKNQLNVIGTNGKQLPGWPKQLSSKGQYIWSNQAIGDLDNDGDYEIVVGSQYYNTSEDRDNKIYAYHHNGQMVSGWPVDLNPSGELTGWVLSSPVIGDLDGNGTLEVTVGSDDNRLWVLKGNGTNFNSNWPKYIPYGFKASPAIADLDKDDDLEIVIGHRSNLDPNLRLYAYHHEGIPVNNWPYIMNSGSGGFTFGWISPVIGDIDNNDTLDIISISEVGSYLGTGGGDIFAIGANAMLLNGFPLGLPEISYSSVTISDVDGDNEVDLLAGDLSGQVFIWDLPFHYDKERIPWSQFRHDNWNTGLFGFKPVPPRPIALDVTVCEGDSIPGLAASGENVQWYSDADLTTLVYTGKNFATNNLQAGTYIYYVTQTVFGCKSPATKVTMIISSAPSPPLGYNMETCNGKKVPDLTILGDSIRWYTEANLLNLVYSGNFYTTGKILPGIYNYFVTQTLGECESKADTVILTIVTVPSPPITQGVSVCENQPVPELTAVGENVRWYSDSTLTILLHSGGNFSSDQKEPGEYKFYSTQTISDCESEFETINLVINPLPAITLGKDTTISRNQSIMLGPYNEHYNYLWDNGSIDPYIDISGYEIGLGFHSISVTVTNTSNCIYSDSIIINVVKCAVTNTLSREVCETYSSPSGKYVWTSSGVYKDTIPSAAGCDSIITVNLTILSPDISISENQSVLRANADEASYQWIDCDNGNLPLEGETQQAFTAKTSGNYAVIVTQYGCTDTSACFSVIITGLVINTYKQNITLYPNPNKGSFSIDLGRVYPNAEISISEMDGRIIRKDEVFNNRIIDVELSAAPGMYLVIISSGYERAVFKIMKK